MFNKKDKEKVKKPFGERKIAVLLALFLGLIIGGKVVPKLIHIIYLVTIVILAVLWVTGTPIPFK